MTVNIELELSEEDAKKLKRAFEDGTFARLGITSVVVKSMEATEQQKRWAISALENRGKDKDDTGTPNLP